jgi:sulfite exporter TauE/SafE
MTFGNSLYLWALGYGLVGGFAHCIGMCGVFVLSYAGLPDAKEQRRFLHPVRHLLFHTGRLVSLTMLGLLGGVIGDLGHRWADAQSIVSITAGLIMFGLALGLAGVLPRFRMPEPDLMNASGGRLRRLFLRALKSRSAARPLLIGLFVGLLPCGLTYTALIGTFTLRPLSGALLMMLFGLGTVPGLLTLGLFGNGLFGGLLTSLRFRSRMTQAAAVIMGILAIAFVWRGVTNF